MKTYLLYLQASGEVLWGGRSNAQPAVKAGQAWIEWPDWRNAHLYYVELGDVPVVRERTDMGASIDRLTMAADGSDVVTITGIPAGTQVVAFGEPYAVDDGEFSFTTEVARTHRITLRHPRHHDLTFEVVAE